MIRADFENYMPIFGEGNKLVTALLRVVDYVEVYPRNAAQILAKFDLDVAKVRAKLQAAINSQVSVTVTGAGTVAVGADLTLTVAVSPSSFDYAAGDVTAAFDATKFTLKSKTKTSVVLTATAAAASTSVTVSVKSVPAAAKTVAVTA